MKTAMTQRMRLCARYSDALFRRRLCIGGDELRGRQRGSKKWTTRASDETPEPGSLARDEDGTRCVFVGSSGFRVPADVGSRVERLR